MLSNYPTLNKLGRVYTQLEAAVGEFGLATLTASTRALASNSPGDSVYSGIENQLAALGAARNALVAQMQALLTGAEFGGKPISAKTGKSLISQGNALLAQARHAGPRLGPPEEDEGAVVGAAGRALQVGDQGPGAGIEAAGQHALGLAEQAVGAGVDVAAGRLHQAIGVEHQRVAALQGAAFGLGHGAAQVGEHAEHDPAGPGQAPAAAAAPNARWAGGLRGDHVLPEARSSDRCTAVTKPSVAAPRRM